jgi:hypothetical protein
MQRDASIAKAGRFIPAPFFMSEIAIAVSTPSQTAKPKNPISVQISKYPQSKLVVVIFVLNTGLKTVTVLPKPYPVTGESAITQSILGKRSMRERELFSIAGMATLAKRKPKYDQPVSLPWLATRLNIVKSEKIIRNATAIRAKVRANIFFVSSTSAPRTSAIKYIRVRFRERMVDREKITA